MKIGLDLRFLKENDLYSSFVMELVTELVKKLTKNTYNIYTNKDINIKQSNNKIIKNINIKLGSIKEQFSFYKILKKDNNDIMIFFKIYKPILYRGEYYLFIHSLNKVYYQNFNTYFKKYKYLYLLNKSISLSKKIICFDENTKDELAERLDIKEDKIATIKPFFTGLNRLENTTNIKLDIKIKNNIKNPFLLYNGGIGIEKNIDKLIKVIKKINESTKLDLVVIGEDIAKDLNIRDLIILEKIQNNIHFIGNIKDEEKKNYYDSSIGVIFPSLYESFPFHLNEAVFYNTNIITGNLTNIKNIFGESIFYFFSTSTSSMINNIKLFLKEKSKPNYSNVVNKINKNNTTVEFINIIK